MLAEYYEGAGLVGIGQEESGFLPANPLRDSNRLELHLEGNDERMTLVSIFDNLGKGASGAAVQNMNIVLGLEETTGLV